MIICFHLSWDSEGADCRRFFSSASNFEAVFSHAQLKDLKIINFPTAVSRMFTVRRGGFGAKFIFLILESGEPMLVFNTAGTSAWHVDAPKEIRKAFEGAVILFGGTMFFRFKEEQSSKDSVNLIEGIDIEANGNGIDPILDYAQVNDRMYAWDHPQYVRLVMGSFPFIYKVFQLYPEVKLWSDIEIKLVSQTFGETMATYKPGTETFIKLLSNLLKETGFKYPGYLSNPIYPN